MQPGMACVLLGKVYCCVQQLHAAASSLPGMPDGGSNAAKDVEVLVGVLLLAGNNVRVASGGGPGSPDLVVASAAVAVQPGQSG